MLKLIINSIILIQIIGWPYLTIFDIFLDRLKYSIVSPFYGALKKWNFFRKNNLNKNPILTAIRGVSTPPTLRFGFARRPLGGM